ncbi:MAG: deoxyguanosinetriphosphate triphosphohydrolase [Corynebacterium sp.]|nr:deoxyguanosinetriphosphate triphosphohydrolase [Corynebacterium sp.]
MYPYSGADTARRFAEDAKGSALSSDAEHRDAFARDRARVLHSAALRRLADKTQVVGPREGDNPRTRLTHSLEVAQIARGIGSGLGLHPDLCEMAGLTHDIGHPPFGHNGETALNMLADECGGFEGNAQTLRILTRLEPKVFDITGEESFGLNLTRASLDAALKYPRLAQNPDGSKNRKYSCYDEDAEILKWIRPAGITGVAMEAQVMDFSDDIAYSVHDVEDGIASGRISLKVLGDLVELSELADKGVRAFGGNAKDLIEAAARLRELPVIAAVENFAGTFSDLVALKRMTSELVGRYVGAILAATLDTPDSEQPNSGEAIFGRHHGKLVVPPEVLAEVTLLKSIAVLYVMDEQSHLRQQQLQHDRIFRVYEYFAASPAESMDPAFQWWWRQSDDVAGRQRAIIDQIASLTESRLERIDKQASEFSFFLA